MAMTIIGAIRRFERKAFKVSRGQTYAEFSCGKQFLLAYQLNSCWEIVPDGLMDPDEYCYAVYRLNIFGRLVKKNYYTF